jgi:hypothetical protein
MSLADLFISRLAGGPRRITTAVQAPLRSQSQRRISFNIIGALVVWLMVVCGATILMTRYANTPGNDGPAPAAWPNGSHLSFDSIHGTLLMFVHPHCPCTRASLGELEQLLAEVSKPPTVQVAFVKPPATAPDWAATDLWRNASAILGVKVYLDSGGLEAQRFHAGTSGQTLLYGRDGRLRFQGGITLARGHAGDNPGRTALRELLREGHSHQVQTPVFGCGLFESQCQKGDVLCKP